MAFFVNKSLLVFLLSILLVIHASHGNNHLPDQLRVGDRKLLSFFKNFGNIFKPKTAPPKTPGSGLNWIHNNHKPFHPNPTPRKVNTVDEDTKRLEDWIEASTHVVDLSQELESDHKVIEATMNKTAHKLFGANGEQSFQIGWKVGKWIYKVNKKCLEFEKALNVTCDQQSSLPDQTPGMSCVMLAAGKTGNVTCNEGVFPSVVTPEFSIPCFYFNGTIYNRSGKPFDLVAKNPVKDCAIK